MKIARDVLVVVLLAAFSAFAQQSNNSKRRQPKVTKKQATATALAKVPGGTIKESQLEKEHGKLVWSFDIEDKDKQITEVQVDAKTGNVVSVEKESAAHEAAEKKSDRKKH